MMILSTNSTNFTVGRKADPDTNRSDNDCFAVRLSTSSAGSRNGTSFTLPIYSTDTNIYAQISGTKASSNCHLTLTGYRRIGTNS